jgi:hypothetical protein
VHHGLTKLISYKTFKVAENSYQCFSKITTGPSSNIFNENRVMASWIQVIVSVIYENVSNFLPERSHAFLKKKRQRT